MASTSAVSSAIVPNACFACSKRYSCKNRSLQVYPVMTSSGSTITFAPAAAASRIPSTITPALYFVSATRIFGVTAATFTNPSLIFSFPLTRRCQNGTLCCRTGILPQSTPRRLRCRPDLFCSVSQSHGRRAPWSSRTGMRHPPYR